MSEPMETLYRKLGGTGSFTCDRLILLLIYHAGAATLNQLVVSGAVSSKVYAGNRLKRLTAQNYLMRHAGVIPSPFLRGRGSDIYTLTEDGEAYVTAFILQEDPVSRPDIHSKKDPERFRKEHLQVLHNIGMLDFFYNMLPCWDAGSSWYVERILPGARMRPDCEYRHTGDEEEDNYVYYLEEDTGTQKGDAIQKKWDAYAEFMQAGRTDVYDMRLMNSCILFHLNDLRAIGGQLPAIPSLGSQFRRLDRKYRKRYGDDYSVPADSKDITPNMAVYLPYARNWHAAFEIQMVARLLEERQREVTDRMIFEAVRAYAAKRITLFMQCRGLEEAWRQGLQTLAFPARYDRQYLMVCQPFRFFPLERYLTDIGDYRRCRNKDGKKTVRQILKYEDVLIFPRYTLYSETDGYLVIENISHDLSGAYRAGQVLSLGRVSILLIAEDTAAAEAFIRKHPPAVTMKGIYAMCYEDIWKHVPKLYDLSAGRAVPVGTEDRNTGKEGEAHEP